MESQILLSRLQEPIPGPCSEPDEAILLSNIQIILCLLY
jgi:hypothetical protein